MGELTKKRCVPCEGGIAPLSAEESVPLLKQLRGWKIRENRLERSFVFPDFRSALDFVNRVGALAEAEDHHPDLHLAWGKVRIELWTHAVNGLTENDFILAAKIDAL